MKKVTYLEIMRNLYYIELQEISNYKGEAWSHLRIDDYDPRDNEKAVGVQ